MRNSRIFGRLQSASGAVASLCFLFALSASILPSLSHAGPSTMMGRQPDFDSRSLHGGESSVSGFSLNHPSRFSMHQSYSVSAYSGSGGSSSSGLYLNTVSYRVADPLFLFVDVGLHTPIHSSIQGMNGNTGTAASSVVLPRMGLEYRPNDRLTLNVELFNGPDAYKAYGYDYGFGRSLFNGSRFP